MAPKFLASPHSCVASLFPRNDNSFAGTSLAQGSLHGGFPLSLRRLNWWNSRGRLASRPGGRLG